MSDPHSKWNWPPEEIKRVGYKVVDIIADHLTTLPTRPVFRPVPTDVARRLHNEPMPVHGQDADEVLEAFLRGVEPYPFGNGHPRFFGWVNSPPALMGIFADALCRSHERELCRRQPRGRVRRTPGRGLVQGTALVSCR